MAIRKKHSSGKDRGGVRTGTVSKLLFCAVLFAALVTLPVFINSAIGYLPVLTYIFLLATCFAYPRVVARKLEFGVLLNADTCVRDTEVAVLARFVNAGMLPCLRVDATLQVTDAYGHVDAESAFSFAVDPRSKRDFDLGVRFAHVGTACASVSGVIIYDPLGLFACRMNVDVREEIEVLPHIYAIDRSLLDTLQLEEVSEATSPFGSDGMDYTGVREYVYGDPLKSVHWKLSSHLEGLLTRLFDTAGEPSLDIVCGTYFGASDWQTAMSLYDTELEIALSLFDFAVEEKLPARVSFMDDDGYVRTFSDYEHDSQHELIRSFPGPRDAAPGSLMQIIERKATGAFTGGNLLVCTAELSDEVANTLDDAAKRGRRVVVFYCIPPGLDAQGRREAERPARRLNQGLIRCFVMESAQEIEDAIYE